MLIYRTVKKVAGIIASLPKAISAGKLWGKIDLCWLDCGWAARRPSVSREVYHGVILALLLVKLYEVCWDFARGRVEFKPV